MALKYSQEALATDELLNRLSSKKLLISDSEHVSHCLKTIGYHRLSFYFDPFKSYHSSEWEFKPSVSFDNIWK